jgi:hypothetical protein
MNFIVSCSGKSTKEDLTSEPSEDGESSELMTYEDSSALSFHCRVL